MNPEPEYKPLKEAFEAREAREREQRRRTIRTITGVYIGVFVVWIVLDKNGFQLCEGLLFLPILPLVWWVIWDLTRIYRKGER